MTKSGRAEKSRTLFAHAVLAQIKEEKLIQSHFTDDDRPNPPVSKCLILNVDQLGLIFGFNFSTIRKQ